MCCPLTRFTLLLLLLLLRLLLLLLLTELVVAVVVDATLVRLLPLPLLLPLLYDDARAPVLPTASVLELLLVRDTAAVAAAAVLVVPPPSLPSLLLSSSDTRRLASVFCRAPANPTMPERATTGLLTPDRERSSAAEEAAVMPIAEDRPEGLNNDEAKTVVLAFRTSVTRCFSSEYRNMPMSCSDFAFGSVKRGPTNEIMDRRVFIEGVSSMRVINCALENR